MYTERAPVQYWQLLANGAPQRVGNAQIPNPYPLALLSLCEIMNLPFMASLRVAKPQEGGISLPLDK